MNRARGSDREDALDIFLYALNASRVEVAMERSVRFGGGALQIDRHSYSLNRYGRLVLIALGKAAGSMATVFLRHAAVVDGARPCDLSGEWRGLGDGGAVSDAGGFAGCDRSHA
jgi:hypothetical protein